MFILEYIIGCFHITPSYSQHFLLPLLRTTIFVFVFALMVHIYTCNTSGTCSCAPQYLLTSLPGHRWYNKSTSGQRTMQRRLYILYILGTGKKDTSLLHPRYLHGHYRPNAIVLFLYKRLHNQGRSASCIAWASDEEVTRTLEWLKAIQGKRGLIGYTVGARNTDFVLTSTLPCALMFRSWFPAHVPS